MTIIIEGFLCFDEKNGSITNLTTADSITLPLTASLIFSYILSRQGEIIERSELFENIWGKYGQAPSNNTLTQYISLIRRSLHHLGLPSEIIITIPKTGFKVPMEIELVVKDPLISSSSKTQILDVHNGSQEIGNRKRKKIVFFSFLFTTALGVIISLQVHIPSKFDEQSLRYLGEFQNCQINSVSLMSNYQSEKALERVKKYAPTYLPCTPGDVYLVGKPHIVSGDKSRRFFLGRCTQLDKNHDGFSFCKSIYLYE